MKILHVCNGNVQIGSRFGGGTEKYILHLAQRQNGMGNSVTVLDRRRGTSNDSERPGGIHVIRIRVPALIPSAGAFSSIGGTFGRFRSALTSLLFGLFVLLKMDFSKYDAVNYHDPFTILPVAMFSRYRTRSILTQHGVSMHQSDLLITKLYQPIRIFAMRRAAGVITLNPVAMDQAIRETGKSRTTVKFIPVGINPIEMPELENQINIRRIFALRNIIVLYVGRVAPEKGIEVLVRACDILVHQRGRSDVSFVILGPNEHFEATTKISPYGAKLRRMVSALGLGDFVIFTGMLPDSEVNDFYSACSVFVLPSFFESFPLVVLEAMAFRKPIIASRLPGTAVQITNGHNGILVDPGDVQGMAEKIQNLLDNPSEAIRIGINGFNSLKTRFDWESVAKKTVVAYQDINALSG